MDCVDIVMIRDYFKKKDPTYYRMLTNNGAPTDRTDEEMIERFYREKRRKRPETASNLNYVTSIDRNRMGRFLENKRRQSVSVMTTGIIALPKRLLNTV